MLAVKKDNYYEFPTISIRSKIGKNTLTTIYCGVIRKDADVNAFKKLTDPKEITNIAARLKAEYSDNSIITDNIKGFIVLRQGYEGGKISFKAATYINVGTNLGKANQRNVWTQALEKATSKYNDKNRPNMAPELFRPMLADGSAVSKNLLNHELASIYKKHKGNMLVQYKYDGHRMLCRLSDQYCYSRKAKKTFISDELADELSIVNTHIKSALPEYNDYNVFLDGEYYLHGKMLQNISSSVRGEFQSDEKSQLIFYVFDVPTTTQDNKITDIPCLERIKCLGKLREYFAKYEFKNIIFVKSWLNPLFSSLKKHFNEALEQEYEGLVMKLCDKEYEPGYNNYHSRYMIKIKLLLREEFLVCGYKTGKGKDENKITLICKLTEETIDKAVAHIKSRGGLIGMDIAAAIENTFSVKPKLTDEENEQLYQDIVSETIKIEGKLYTVEFREWSENLIPVQPVGIEFYE